jgi:hypothetical protein
VHGPQLVRREGAGVLDGPGGGPVEAVDEHQHDVPPEDGGGGGELGLVLELGVLLRVLPVQPQQQEHRRRQEHEDDPGTVHELGDGDDHADGGRDEGAEAVDGQPPLPPLCPLPEVVLGHCRLRQGE